MAIRARSFTIEWKAAADQTSYNGFNVVISLSGWNPNEAYLDKRYVRPDYAPDGVYRTQYSNFLIDDAYVYDIWVQSVSYGKDSMWRSAAGWEIPDDGIGSIGGGFDFGSITQEELDAGLDNKTINGINTDITNINGGNIIDGTITADKIIAGSITADHIKANSINTGHIQANSINTGHIQAVSITSDHLQSNSIATAHIQADAITAGLIRTSAIESDHILAGAIVSHHIDTNSIESRHILAGSIESSHIATGSIESANIKAGAILTEHISSATIEGHHIKAETIESGSLVTGTIKASKIDTADLFSVNSTVTGVLTVTGGGRIDLGNGNILASGSVTATSGRIGNWLISGNTLQSNTDLANRIVLDQTASRISVVSDTSSTKVAMGYLGGLPRNDDPLTNYTSSDYGFWAAPGDKLHIDGDAEYTSGDWIISHDSAYLVKDSGGNTIVKLGSDAGAHGVHIFDTSGSKLAEYSASKILIGQEVDGVLTAGLRYTDLNGLEIIGTVEVSSSSIMNAMGWAEAPEDGATKFTSSTTISGGQITTGTISADRIAANSITASKLSSAETFVGLSIQSNGYVAGSSGWQIKKNGEFYFYGPSGKSFTFNGSTFQFTGTIVAASNVSGLGSLATMSSVSDSYITSISGGKITTNSIVTDHIKANNITTVCSGMGGHFAYASFNATANGELAILGSMACWRDGTLRIYVDGTEVIAQTPIGGTMASITWKTSVGKGWHNIQILHSSTENHSALIIGICTYR